MFLQFRCRWTLSDVNMVPRYFVQYHRQSLTHWGRDKMVAVFQTFSNAFSWMKMHEVQLWFHWQLFLRVQLTIFQPNRRQAIIWTNDGLFHRSIYASCGLNDLTKKLSNGFWYLPSQRPCIAVYWLFPLAILSSCSNTLYQRQPCSQVF